MDVRSLRFVSSVAVRPEPTMSAMPSPEKTEIGSSKTKKPMIAANTIAENCSEQQIAAAPCARERKLREDA